MAHINKDIILQLLDGTQDEKIEEHIKTCNKCFVEYHAAKAQFNEARLEYNHEAEILEAQIEAAKKFNFAPPGLEDSYDYTSDEKETSISTHSSMVDTEINIKNDKYDKVSIPAQLFNSSFTPFITATGIIIFAFYINMFNPTHSNIYDFRNNVKFSNSILNAPPEYVDKGTTRGSLNPDTDSDGDGIKDDPEKIIEKIKSRNKQIISRNFENKSHDEIIEYARNNNLCVRLEYGNTFNQIPKQGESFNAESDTLIIVLPNN